MCFIAGLTEKPAYAVGLQSIQGLTPRGPSTYVLPILAHRFALIFPPPYDFVWVTGIGFGRSKESLEATR